MFESRREKYEVRVYRGPNFGTTLIETETIHRIPPSDEGWCYFHGLLAWWDGTKGISISLLYGESKELSTLLGKGAGYKNLGKFQLPSKKFLTEISCENELLGFLDCCWLISEPISLEKIVIQISIHRNWYHLYHTQHKGKVLGHNSSLSLGSVETDHEIFVAFIGNILGKT